MTIRSGLRRQGGLERATKGRLRRCRQALLSIGGGHEQIEALHVLSVVHGASYRRSAP
jgi:hypothetical protein